MITFVDVIGYIASLFVALTFYSKMMIPLRIFALLSNVFFIIYAYFLHSYPILILHSCMLPLNSFRLYQIVKLINKVNESAESGCSMECLIPFMTSKKYKKGDIIFKKGDISDNLYYILNGSVKLVEINRIEKQGATLGEFGVFSQNKQRTLTIECLEDMEVAILSREKIFQIFYTNPKFSFFIIKLIIKRYIEYTKLFNDKI